MHTSLAVCTAILFVLMGCAPYSPAAIPVPKIETMPVSKSAELVTVGADPFVQKERQKVVFNAELGDVGVLPIQVFVRNDGDRTLWVRPSEITLTLPDGTQIHSSRAVAVSALKDPGSGAAIGALILGGAAGAIGGSITREQVRSARLKDYQNKEFPDVTLDKGREAHGFVFFIPPGGTKSFSDAVLNVRLVDNTARLSFVVQVPISGVEFKGKAD